MRPDPLQLPETAGADMPVEDQFPIAVFVFFAVLGVGLLVGENIGWAFAVGLAFTPVLAGIVRWMERQ